MVEVLRPFGKVIREVQEPQKTPENDIKSPFSMEEREDEGGIGEGRDVDAKQQYRESKEMEGLEESSGEEEDDEDDEDEVFTLDMLDRVLRQKVLHEGHYAIFWALGMYIHLQT